MCPQDEANGAWRYITKLHLCTVAGETDMKTAVGAFLLVGVQNMSTDITKFLAVRELTKILSHTHMVVWVHSYLLSHCPGNQEN